MSKTMFWTIEPGQILEDEVVDSGSPDGEIAKELASGLEEAGVSYILAKLRTVEHEYAETDPRYDPDEVIRSERWCVVVSK